MNNDNGASPAETGLSSLRDGAAKASPPEASIPSALTLDFAAIDEIYKAGVRRGNDEATSYEWGSSPSGKFHDELIDALHDILNAGKGWDDAGHRDWQLVKNWVAASAIEARSDATGTGAAVGESATPSGETPNV